MRRVARGFAEGLLIGGAGWLLGYWAGWKHGRRDLRGRSVAMVGQPHVAYAVPEDDQPGWWLELKRWALMVNLPGARQRWGE